MEFNTYDLYLNQVKEDDVFNSNEYKYLKENNIDTAEIEGIDKDPDAGEIKFDKDQNISEEDNKLLLKDVTDFMLDIPRDTLISILRGGTNGFQFVNNFAGAIGLTGEETTEEFNLKFDKIKSDLDNAQEDSPFVTKMIAMAGQSLNEVFIFRYYSDGKENLMEAWTSWLMPGTVQFIATHSDDMYAVTKQGNQFTLSKAALSQSPEEAIIVNNQGQKVNPSVDLYATASSVTYDSDTKVSKCYLPYNDVSSLTPIIVISGDTSSGSFVESGFTVTPERDSDDDGAFFSVANKDLTGVADDVIVGFKYNFDVELPRTYYRPDPKVTDFTANLTIARMKFAVGLSGMMSFKLQQTGRLPYEVEFTGDGSTTTYTFSKRDLDYVDRSDVLVTVNGVNETGFSFTNDTTIEFDTAPDDNAKIKFFIKEWFSVQPTIEANTYLANDVPLDNENVFTIPIHQRTENFRLKMFNNSPFPVAVNAMMWEGKYTPRFYRRA